MHSIIETIEQYHMIGSGMHVIAGISGGADSVCLLFALCEYRKMVPFELTAVHVEHGLRGEESLADAAFTQELCARFEVPCRVVHVQAAQLARAEGLSTEEAGRRERYRTFHEIQKECGAQRIAVAHNQNDQAETVLWNLARGSGLRGLCGMSPVRGDIIRPLLFTDRARIEEILREAGLSWRTDRTNLQTEYTRNRIRLSLLPQMERDLNSRAAGHIAEAAGRLRQVQEYLDRETDRAAGSCICEDGASLCIDLPLWRERDPLIRQELLKRAVGMCGGLKDFGRVHLQALEALCEMDCGKELCLPGRLRAVREREIVRLTREAGAELPGTAGRLAGENRNVPAGEDRDIFAGKSGDASVGENRDTSAGKSGDTSAGENRNVSTGENRDTSVGKSGDTSAGENRNASARENRNTPAQQEIQVPVPGTFRADGRRVRTELYLNRPELRDQIITEKKYTKWLSYDTINSNILQFRKRRPGDYLVIDSRGGRKKLKDYLIDLKVPRAQRDRIWLLAAGSHVLWVVGYRISEAAKVTESTKELMKIQMEEEQNEGKDTDFADRTGSQQLHCTDGCAYQ